VLTTAVFIAGLSPALVRAERFIFPTYFVMGAVGVVTAIRTVGSARRLAMKADQHAWLPIAVWMVTFLLSLGSKVVRL
jgi:ABC-type transport system involved in cytochrome c biogenesis permease subunit